MRPPAQALEGSRRDPPPPPRRDRRLIGSAAYAYSIKYDTLYYAEELAKLKAKIQRERDAVAIAKAEWALLTRPDRLQRIVDQHLDLQPLR